MLGYQLSLLESLPKQHYFTEIRLGKIKGFPLFSHTDFSFISFDILIVSVHMTHVQLYWGDKCIFSKKIVLCDVFGEEYTCMSCNCIN